MNSFTQLAKKITTPKSNVTINNDGIKAYKSAGSYVIDLFSKIGALRGANEETVISLFKNSLEENQNLSLATLLYSRDIRKGLGERKIFRTLLTWLAENQPKLLTKEFIGAVPEIGRWDDLFVLFNTDSEHLVVELIKNQFKTDCLALKTKGSHPSLLAKWMPSENTSSKESKRLAKICRTHLELSSREYRRNLTSLRKQLRIVESLMSKKNWKKINYEHVPSKANMLYRKAFLKRDTDRRKQFLEGLKNGTKKVNTSVLYPYEILAATMRASQEDQQELQLVWNNLPNWIEGHNPVLIMADHSGSMSGRPMDIATSLAIYFAERNKGDYSNLFITFTDTPKFVSFEPTDTLYDKILTARVDCGYSTNLNEAFDLVLTHAIKNEVKPSDLPRAIVVISDMQMNDGGQVDFKIAKAKFKRLGYEMPNLVWWNVNAQKSQVDEAQEGVIFISGSSSTVFKDLLRTLNGQKIDPMIHIVETLQPYMKYLG